MYQETFSDPNPGTQTRASAFSPCAGHRTVYRGMEGAHWCQQEDTMVESLNEVCANLGLVAVPDNVALLQLLE